MPVRGRGVFVTGLAMLERSNRMLLSFFVLAQFVMMRRLMVMVRRSMMVGGCPMVMVARRMFR